MIDLSTIINYWNIFFFKEEPASTIGLVRILFGIIAFIDFALLWKKSNLYFGENGLYPHRNFQYSNTINRLNLFKYIPSKSYYINIALILGILSSVCLFVGYYTTIACSVAFFIKTSLCHRNIYIFNSGDSLFRILMFFMIFSRAGEGLSIDCYLNNQSQLYNMGSPWCERLMMIQLCSVYGFTAWHKLCSKSWVDGDASYYPINLYSFRNCYVPLILRKSPWVQLASWLTLIVEEMLAFLIWVKELRYLCLVSGIILHAVFAYCLKLQLFSYIMIASLLLFIQPEDLSKLIEELCGML